MPSYRTNFGRIKEIPVDDEDQLPVDEPIEGEDGDDTVHIDVWPEHGIDE